jgi:hypothetical protein
MAIAPEAYRGEHTGGVLRGVDGVWGVRGGWWDGNF